MPSDDKKARMATNTKSGLRIPFVMEPRIREEREEKSQEKGQMILRGGLPRIWYKQPQIASAVEWLFPFLLHTYLSC
jgi:hypothetical protein